MSRDRIDRLYEAIRRADQAYEVWAAAHGLALYELQIYYEMMKNEGEAIRQKDLCKTLDAPKTSINSMVKKRMQSGHFCMDVNPENKREKIISFTSEGKKFAKELIEPLFQYEEEGILFAYGTNGPFDVKTMPALEEAYEMGRNI